MGSRTLKHTKTIVETLIQSMEMGSRTLTTQDIQFGQSHPQSTMHVGQPDTTTLTIQGSRTLSHISV